VEVTGQEARFRAMFAEEAEGHLTTLSELLLELEGNGHDPELLSSVFRESHTLKGAAAVVGLADVLRVAHAMEEVLAGEDCGVQADRLAASLHNPAREADAAEGDPEPERDAAEPTAGPGPAPTYSEEPPPGPVPPANPVPPPGPVPPPDPPPGPTSPPGRPAPPAQRRRRETIRLQVERLDELVRLVGEASAVALRLGRVVTDRFGLEPAVIPELHDLSRVLESLQERTLQVRMVPFGTIAEPLRRAARDLTRSLGKAVELELRGQETELDRACSSRSPIPSST
jgi:two-component system, chemotaxis family, sensor kinase CheA